MDDIDRHIGERIRQRRKLLGISSEAMGARLGVTFQQVSKLETAITQISAARLWELAGILGVPLMFFFEGAPMREVGELEHPDPMQSTDAMRLVTAWLKLDAMAGAQLLAFLERLTGPKVRE